MTTDRIARLSETIDTKLVVFIRASHQLTPNYMTTMLEYLRLRTAYLAEPVVYTGGIPNNGAATKIDDAYRWARDTDSIRRCLNTYRLKGCLRSNWRRGSFSPLPQLSSLLVHRNRKAARYGLLGPI